LGGSFLVDGFSKPGRGNSGRAMCTIPFGPLGKAVEIQFYNRIEGLGILVDSFRL